MNRTEQIAGVADPVMLRRGFTLYPRGVMAVAGEVDGEPVGLAVSAFVSVSLQPPLMAICIDRASSTWPRLVNAAALGVSVLGEDQAWLARQLAARGDRFAGAEYEVRPSGAILFAGTAARFEGTIDAIHPGGDHLVVMLAVQEMWGDPEIRPLIWHDSHFAGLTHRVDPNVGQERPY